LPCSPKQFFQITGGGKLMRKPWAAGNLLRAFDDCEQSRKYNKWFKNGKLLEDGTHVAGKTLAGEGPAADAASASAPAPDEAPAAETAPAADVDNSEAEG
jgi:hypothetical protein